MNFSWNLLIKKYISILKQVINLNISYTLTPWFISLNSHFTLNNCLFRFVIVTKNAIPDKCKGSAHSIGFDSHSEFSFADGSMGRNFIIFGANMSSSVKIDNKGKDILIFGKGPKQVIDNTALTAEVKYPNNFTQPNKRFVLSLYYHGRNSFLFINATKIHQRKECSSKIKEYALWLGNIYN